MSGCRVASAVAVTLTVLLAVVVCAVTAADVASSSPHTLARKRVMPWMCLERCGDNATAITAQLHVRPPPPLFTLPRLRSFADVGLGQALAEHKELISGVAFELFNLGAKGTLVTNNLTQVLPFLQREGFKTYPSTRTHADARTRV
jgi:hypothetical protein